MAEPRYIKVVKLRKTEEGDKLEKMVLELNGEKGSILFFEPDEDVSYPDSKAEEINYEDAEKLTREHYGYNPTLKS